MDVRVPFKGKHVVETTKRAWLVDLARPPKDYHQSAAPAECAACWCGATPGSCNDCTESDMISAIASQAAGHKVHVGSGEDADLFR